MPPCPAPEHLARLLDDELGEADRLPLEGHVEDCPLCQATLQQLVEGEASRLGRSSLPGRDQAQGPPLSDRDEAQLARLKLARSTHRFPAAPAEPAELPVLPGYELLGLLGQGGMGIVYRARQVSLNRIVALKMIRAAHAGLEEELRFRIEGELAARLHHPNIVQIFEVGSQAGRPFFAFEHVDGGSLRDRLGEAPLPARQAAELVAILARAAHHAHQQGVVHRDLKPANILFARPADVPPGCGDTPGSGLRVTPFGIPKVADFGLARSLDAGPVDLRLTRTGCFLGTPGYMAPEQFRGDPRAIGPASDTWALGVILYELLTGRLPFDSADLMELARQVTTQEPAPPRALVPACPRDLQCVCLKCLEKEPARRYASAQALAEDLERFAQGEPVQARAVGRAERLWRLCRRNPLVSLLVMAVAASLLVGLATSLHFAIQAERRAGEAQAFADSAARSEAEARQEERAGRRILYGAHLSLAQRAWEVGWLARVDELLDVQHPSRTGEEMRGFEWHHLHRLRRSELRTVALGAWARGIAFSPDGSRMVVGLFEEHPGRGEPGGLCLVETATGRKLFRRAHDGLTFAVAFAPDGQTFASAGGDGAVILWDQSGRRVRSLKAHQGMARAVAFRPDGALLASCGSDGQVCLWDARTGQQRRCWPAEQGPLIDLAFSPDGQRLATASLAGTIRVWDAPTGQLRRMVRGHRTGIHRIAWAPDGKLLATGGGDRTARLWDAGTGQELFVLRGRGGVEGLAFSRDGQLLATAPGGGGLLRFWSTSSGEQVGALRGHDRTATALAFSPDGLQLAAAGADGMLRLWAVDVQSPLALHGHTAIVDAVAWAPDGQELASAGRDGSIRLWCPLTGQEVRALSAPRWVRGLAYSPDGRRLAAAAADGTLRTWSLPGGRPEQVMKGHRGAVTAVAWDRAGRRLASAGADGTVRVWDAGTARELHVFRGHTNEVRGVAWSDDGRLASCGKDRTARLWDLRSGEVLRLAPRQEDTLHGVAFAPGGGRLAVAGVGKVWLWDLPPDQALTPAHVLSHTSYVTGSAFSPDGRRLATVDWARLLRLWDTGTGQEVLSVEEGHDSHPTGVAWASDGLRLATSSQDRTVRIWDARPWTPARRAEWQAVLLLRALFGKPLQRADVVEHLRNYPGLAAEVRARALELVPRFREETQAERYLQASLAVTAVPHLDRHLYHFALRQAEAACRLAPGESACLAGLALAHARLGKRQQAEAVLAELRQVSGTLQGAAGERARQLLGEAEAVLKAAK